MKLACPRDTYNPMFISSLFITVKYGSNLNNRQQVYGKNMVYVHDGKEFILKKKKNLTFFNKVDELGRHCAK